jgi:hypothetical protein
MHKCNLLKFGVQVLAVLDRLRPLKCGALKNARLHAHLAIVTAHNMNSSCSKRITCCVCLLAAARVAAFVPSSHVLIVSAQQQLSSTFRPHAAKLVQHVAAASAPVDVVTEPSVEEAQSLLLELFADGCSKPERAQLLPLLRVLETSYADTPIETPDFFTLASSGVWNVVYSSLFPKLAPAALASSSELKVHSLR